MCRKPKIVQNTVSKSITPGYGSTMWFGTGSCTFKNLIKAFETYVLFGIQHTGCVKMLFFVV